MRVQRFSDREAVLRYLRFAAEVREQRAFETALARRHASEESFLLDGWCRVCDSPTTFTVDRLFGAREGAEGWTPNWRERLVCPGCGLNNRQRAVVGAVSRPVNVLWRPGLTPAGLADAGVRRISVGGALTWVAAHALEDAAGRILENGDFTALERPPDFERWLG